MLGRIKAKCLGACTLPCVRHSYACIPTDVHIWQMYADSVPLFVIRQEFLLTFAHLPPTWQTLTNSEQTWLNVSWQMHTFSCVWPDTFAKCVRSLRGLYKTRPHSWLQCWWVTPFSLLAKTYHTSKHISKMSRIPSEWKFRVLSTVVCHTSIRFLNSVCLSISGSAVTIRLTVTFNGLKSDRWETHYSIWG